MVETILSGVMERDLNPFFLFDSSGKAIYLNQSAELLLGYANPNAFFQLAERYATGGKSYEMRFEPLSFRSFQFYGLMAGKDNDLIGLRLYQVPLASSQIGATPLEAPSVNIAAILDANIALFRSKSRALITVRFDPALPSIRLDQNKFSKLIGRALDSFGSNADPILISLKVQRGEGKIFASRRYAFAKLVIVGSKRNELFDKTIAEIAQSMWISVKLGSDDIALDIPIIN
ncbi:MAG: hypothetical protein LBQ52_05185 [Helicobacteraceae bacterium]|jgi:hypothetical protein|nr:hypothetical protein [Helicobacteraceae bacterium]